MRWKGRPTTRALKLLMQDHRRIRRLIARAERARRDTGALERAVALACREIADHAAIEERFFYPALRAACPRGQAIEAQVEHAIVENLAAELAAMTPADERYLPTLRVLAAQVEQHVETEEDDLFVRAARSRADFSPLVAALVQRQRSGGLSDVDCEVADLLRDVGGGHLRTRTGRDPQRVREPGGRGAH